MAATMNGYSHGAEGSGFKPPEQARWEKVVCAIGAWFRPVERVMQGAGETAGSIVEHLPEGVQRVLFEQTPPPEDTVVNGFYGIRI